MGRPAVKPRKLGANQLALVCDQCEGIVTRGSRFSEGYLTLVEVEGQDGIRRRQWQMFHDQCRPASVAENGRRSTVVRESRISSYSLLLTTLAGLANDLPGFRDTNWPQLLRRIVADTEWYFDPKGGQRTSKQLTAENHRVYTGVGYTKRLGVEGIK